MDQFKIPALFVGASIFAALLYAVAYAAAQEKEEEEDA